MEETFGDQTLNWTPSLDGVAPDFNVHVASDWLDLKGPHGFLQKRKGWNNERDALPAYNTGSGNHSEPMLEQAQEPLLHALGEGAILPYF